MHAPRKILCLLGACLGLTAAAASAASKSRSISVSRQFLVYGTDVAMRGAMCDLAERTKANLLRVLDQRDRWKTPLIINLESPQANFPDASPAQLEVSQMGFGLKLQLNLLVTGELRGLAGQRELLRAILIEMMYRERSDVAAGTPYVAPPDWLVSGVLGLQPARASDDDAQLLQTVVTANKIAPLEEIVGQRRSQLDAASRRFFDAYSRALVQLLLDVPGGRQKLARFITDLPVAPNDPLADLRAHFPETVGRSPEKWWSLSVARLSAADRYEILSAGETAKLLDRALRLSLPGPDGANREFSLGDYETFRRQPGSRAALEQAGRQLLLLSAHAHPSYRAIVQEEYELVQLLARGKTRKVQERLERVATYRAVIERQASEVDDFLNWYEGTQPKKMSGAFSQVLEAAGGSDEAQPRRRDPISVYLDSIEMQME